MNSNHNERKRPLVSVSILTYNHERFIAQAIESVLAQEVDFEYEIVIAEDCSTDRTREIVLDYAKRYPRLIRPVLQEKNVGIATNSNSLRHACRGIYRAHLEGDDYWCDKKKLQRQIHFLQAHPEYIGIGGAFTCYDENDKLTAFPWEKGKVSAIYALKQDCTKEDVLQKFKLPAHASSLAYRNVFYEMDLNLLALFENTKVIGDRKLATFLSCYGSFRYENKIVLHRRVLKKSNSSYSNMWKNVKNQTAIAYGWFCSLERMAMEGFQQTCGFSVNKKVAWEHALEYFGKTPSRENYQALKEIWNMCDSKSEYRKIAFRLLRKKIKQKKEQEGKLALWKSFFTYPAKVLKKRKGENKNSREKQKVMQGEEFVRKNT